MECVRHQTGGVASVRREDELSLATPERTGAYGI